MAKKRTVHYSSENRGKTSHEHPSKAYHPANVAHARAGKTPFSIRILIGYSSILVMFYLLYFVMGVYRPQLLFLGGAIISYSAIFIDALFVISLFVLIYGLKNRKSWAWLLGIIWYSLSTVHSIASVYLTAPNLYNILRELLVLSSVFIVIINLLIIWYIYTKKDYFRNPRHEDKFGKTDKIFVYSLVCFWAIMILISISIGFNFYKDTTTVAENIVNEIKDTTPIHAIAICETKTGKERDICFVVLVTVFEKENLEPMCGRIDSDLYRFSCMQVRG